MLFKQINDEDDDDDDDDDRRFNATVRLNKKRNKLIRIIYVGYMAPICSPLLPPVAS